MCPHTPIAIAARDDPKTGCRAALPGRLVLPLELHLMGPGASACQPTALIGTVQASLGNTDTMCTLDCACQLGEGHGSRMVSEA